MKNQDIKKILSKLPDSPGVYKFLRGGNILYIGKATSLRDRVRSYFRPDIVETRGPLISKMLSEFDKVDFIKTDSVLESLVLEAHLIKKYQPEANVMEKDDRSFNFVVITDEEFPRVLTVRSRELLKSNPYDISYSFGPFPNGTQLKEALKIIRKMFPYRDKCEPNSGKPCFNRQLGLCPGVCTGEITAKDYAKHIENIILFFEGNKKKLLKNLEKQMESFAKEKKFEEANIAKRTLFTLNHVQDISLIKEERKILQNQETFRIESYDIAHMSGQNVVGVMTVVEDGEVKKSDYRKFKIRDTGGSFSRVLGKNPQTTQKSSPDITNIRFVNDTKALSEVLTRRLAHIEWRFPDLIVVDGGKAQKNVMEKILKNNKQNIPVVSVVKDEKHRPREILGDKKWLKYEKEIILSNSEAHRYAISFHKLLRDKI
ncbi:MAG TPA: hypothetical protein VGC58_01975 [Candidatus Paceibacterota bacterium]